MDNNQTDPAVDSTSCDTEDAANTQLKYKDNKIQNEIASISIKQMERVAVTIRRNFWTILVVVLAVVLIIIGSTLVHDGKAPIKEEIEVFDYTNCTNYIGELCREKKKRKPRQDCDCFLPLPLDEAKNGKVTLFYELDTFDQESDKYKYSRDDRQLRGDLSQQPSPECGAYGYVESSGTKVPIAPCGAIADSMFNDTFLLTYSRSTLVPKTQIGLEGITDEDRKLYHNPPGNLTEAFQNYTKPINWVKNVWEHNAWQVDNDPDNSGFQNEAFIAWMKTDMKMKPAWRVNHTDQFTDGLPAGNYTLRVGYTYPYSLYSGPRKAILRLHIADSNTFKLTVGIILICFAVALVIGMLAYNKVKHGKYLYYVKVED